MNVLKQFNSVFNKKTPTLMEEKQRFVQRINEGVIRLIEHEEYPMENGGYRTWRTPGPSYDEVFRDVCYTMGINASDVIRKVSLPYGPPRTPMLRLLTQDQYDDTLAVICVAYDQYREYPRIQMMLSQEVQKALSTCCVDIGIRWKDGMFYPSGAAELDSKLLDDSLDWLVEFPQERQDFRDALQRLKEKSWSDVIELSYKVVEGVTRGTLGNVNTLGSNIDSLIKHLGISNKWKDILRNYKDYAHNYRHADEKRHQHNPVEVESFLYLTGLLVRMISLQTPMQTKESPLKSPNTL